MNRWLGQGAWAMALGLLWIAFQPCQAKDESKPIVDVRFDAPYQQIASSMGDEWAPTWGRDDVLYTGDDDGTSFGGIEGNSIAFGRLEGADPYSLIGITINGMADFREPLLFGPEAAGWQTLDTYQIEGVRYRFTACDTDVTRLDSSCLASSSDDGKTWKKVTEPGKSLTRGGRFTALSFISHGKTEFLYGKPGEYVYASSYTSVVNGRDNYLVGRVAKTKLAASNAADWSFEQPNGSWGPLETAGQFPNTSYLGLDGANWKTTNSYSVDGALYMFVTRCTYPWRSDDPKHRHVFQNSSIIKSTNNGRTWTRAGPENYSHPMFPGKRFGTAYFVWYGRDGAGSADNADKYVYAVSNNGHFENGDDYVLGRVLRSKLPNLLAADWSFYKGGNGMEEGSWTAELAAATPILSNPGKSGMTGMTYIEGLRRYVMAIWHYHHDNYEQGIDAKDLSTVLEFFEAPTPWGPWTKFKTLDTGRLGWYTPIIGQRFQTTVDSSTVKAFFYATGLSAEPEGSQDLTRYKLNYIPVTLSTRSLQHTDQTFVGARQIPSH